MAARNFQDSTGVSWEVFEVHRSSRAKRGVSEGLQDGWLTFVSPDGKRRLAPFPSDWETMGESELELLCHAARLAPAVAPKSRRSKPVELALSHDSAEHSIEEAVRAFARGARTQKLPAIEAMVKLKALLSEQFSESTGAAPDADRIKRVRRWFVESYYFDQVD